MSVADPMSKVASPLIAIYSHYQAFMAVGGESETYQSPLKNQYSFIEDSIKVEVVANGALSSLWSDLNALDFRVTASLPGVSMLDGYMPLSNLPAVASLSETTSVIPVGWMTTSDQQGMFRNQADTTMGAEFARNVFGVNGSGVTVGVISNSAGRVAVVSRGLEVLGGPSCIPPKPDLHQRRRPRREQ